MIWFPQVIIENYESHKYTKIDFCSGLNMIIGDSDSGKSAIQRAIRWACYNEPSGDDFIRRDADSIMAEINGDKPKVLCRVTIKISNGYTIIRAKELNSTLNRYTLIDPDGEELEFNNFGLEVPDEIRSVLGFHHLTLDKTKLEVNYIPQMESPLAWAYQGAGLSRLLNKFNNIDDFEGLLKRLNKKTHARGEIVTEIKVLQSNIDDKTQELSTLIDPSHEIDFSERLLKEAQELKDREDKINKAKSLLDKHDSLETKSDENQDKIVSLEDLLSFSEDIEALSQLATRVKSANQLMGKAESIRDRTVTINEKLEALTRVADIDIGKLVELSQRIDAAETLSKKATRVGTRIKENNEALEEINESIAQLRKEKHKQLTIIVDELKICPVCEQDLKGDSAKKVIERI